jgi:hypothetical protein
MRKLPICWSLLAQFAVTAMPVRGDDTTGFRFLEQPGPFDVGLRVVQQYDNSRSFGDGSRPPQTLVWYPASRGTTGAHMSYGDYMELRATDPAVGESRQQVGIAGWFSRRSTDKGTSLALQCWMPASRMRRRGPPRAMSVAPCTGDVVPIFSRRGCRGKSEV